MSILSVVVRLLPQYLPEVLARTSRLEGVDLALNPGDGRLVLVIEDAWADGRWHAAASTMASIATWPEVLSTSLVYEYSGPDAPGAATGAATGAEAEAVSAFSSWRGSLAAEPQAAPGSA